MLAGARIHVDAVRAFFGAGGPITIVYAASADRPAWNVVAEFSHDAAAALILSRPDHADEFRTLARAFPAMSVQELADESSQLAPAAPLACGLLVIDDYRWQRDLLRDMASSGARPEVIVSRDGSEDALSRQVKYALLTQIDYCFAGLSGEHSLWTSGKWIPAGPHDGPIVLTELPPQLRSLPVLQGGVVYLDGAMPDGNTIRQISARADFGISGWAMIAEDRPPAKDLYARVTHEETGVEEYLRLPREIRRDVADHFHAEQLLLSGFRADISPLCHRTGVHSVSVLQADDAFRYESGPLLRFALAFQEYEMTARAGLANRYIRGSGIEIGALQKPARLDGACQVRYVDRMSLDKLLEHYPEMARIPVQAPDIVDDGQVLEHIAENSQDFAIANHFLEHCPDPIRSIFNMLRVVRRGGILYLAVPDKRHTFDLRRPVTAYAALKSAFVSGQRAGIPDLFFEWAHLVHNQPANQAKDTARRLMDEDYSIHYNVWATGDLLSFLLAAKHDFQIPFELVAVVSSENETIVLLERTAGRLPI